MWLLERLPTARALVIRQQRELAELIGIETRNKYAIEDEAGRPVAFAAEQQKGIVGAIFRQFLGHWRTFTLHFHGEDRQILFRAVHPFRWIFQRLEVASPIGERLGAIQQRFSLFTKRFDVEDERGRVILTVSSPFWRIWTFPFRRPGGAEAARIEKKWSGLLNEAFTDKDVFALRFLDPALTLAERQVLLAAAIFVDLQYFENKARADWV
jgi:uncharacterized protein YxjI